jgi:hypothetical protein
MITLRQMRVIFFGAAFLAALILLPSTLYAKDDRVRDRMPEGVYIELTQEFYEALRNNQSHGSKTYSNDPSNEYLKQIAISSRFMVETNLQILRHQEKMIRLLENLQGNNK